MSTKYLAEFGGTFVFALGGFIAAGYIPNAAQSHLVTAMIAGVALIIGVLVALKFGGEGALNPGFTIAGAVKGEFNWGVAAGYIAAQILAVLAAYFLYRYIGPMLKLQGAKPNPLAPTSTTVGAGRI
jgi:glycerol uptake facilitator-like aquaporin